MGRGVSARARANRATSAEIGRTLLLRDTAVGGPPTPAQELRSAYDLQLAQASGFELVWFDGDSLTSPRVRISGAERAAIVWAEADDARPQRAVSGFLLRVHDSAGVVGFAPRFLCASSALDAAILWVTDPAKFYARQPARWHHSSV